MDWGIVASVIVANFLLLLGVLLIMGFMNFLFLSGTKKKLKAKVSTGDGPVDKEQPDVVGSYPMTFCPMNKVVE